MTETDEELLGDLLVQWDELRELGEEPSADQLCHDHPCLIKELTRRIQALKSLSWLDAGPSEVNEESLESDSTPPGQRTLIGRYRLENLIAEGGFAQVWRGYDLELQRVVAVKLPKPSRLQSAEAFLAEARRVAQLKHPEIMPVFDVGRDGDSCFIVSEFIERGSLGDLLVKSPPTQPQAVRWIVEIADALEYAHLHGVIHRDIKPANILIDHHGRALLADFGIAQSANEAGKQASSVGTLRYMSPEQLEGLEVDPRADIFSLGIVLHEMLTGKLPYSSEEPNALRREIVAGVKGLTAPQLPTELKRICEKALQHNPQFRHISAAHFAADLRRFLGTPTSAWQRYHLSIAIPCVVLTAIITGLVLLQRGSLQTRSPVANKIELPVRLEGDVPSTVGVEAPAVKPNSAKSPSHPVIKIEVPFWPGKTAANGIEMGKSSLDLSEKNLTDEDFQRLSTCLGLRRLNLTNSTITDDQLATLGRVATIEELNLSGTKITDNGLEALSRLPALSRLYLDHTSITDKGVRNLGRLHLTTLGLSGTQITVDAIKFIKGEMNLLQTLTLANTSLDKKSLTHLQVMIRLRSLDLSGTKIEEQDVDKFRSAVPKCEVIYKNNNENK